jgi:Uma2 family endonuclease
MAAALGTTEQKVILEGISWNTFERLLSERQGHPGTRFAYDRGTLEIMVASFEHENLNRTIAALLELIANQMEIDFVRAGSTTFLRKDLHQGFEPDSCFYIRHAEDVRGKKQIDLKKSPPPDLTIEVDITSPSLYKLPIYSGMGVPEVWRYTKGKLVILKLTAKGYIEAPESSQLPQVTSSVLNKFIDSSQHLKSNIWARQVREWTQTLE